MTKEEAINLYDSSCEVACHGEKHLKLTDIDSARCVYEVITDRKNLEEWFNRRVNGMAYSFGAFDDNIINILKECGIKYARTTISSHNFDLPENWLALKPTCHHADSKLFDLVEKFLNYEQPDWKKQPQMFYLWGHSYEFEDNRNWEVLEEFCQRIGNKEDIWYATNIEICDYVEGYKRLVYSANGYKIYNPNLFTVWIDADGVVYSVKSGETIELPVGDK